MKSTAAVPTPIWLAYFSDKVSWLIQAISVVEGVAAGRDNGLYLGQAIASSNLIYDLGEPG